MLTKIKFLSIFFILALSCQTTVVAMDQNSQYIKQKSESWLNTLHKFFTALLNKTTMFTTSQQKPQSPEQTVNEQLYKIFCSKIAQHVIIHKFHQGFVYPKYRIVFPKKGCTHTDHCTNNSPSTEKVYFYPMRTPQNDLKAISPNNLAIVIQNKKINYLTDNISKSSSFFSTLIQMLSPNSTYNTKIKLNDFLNCLKEKDKQCEKFNQKDIETLKQLWDQYLMFLNYSLTDKFLYPFLPYIKNQKQQKYLKAIISYFHSDQNVKHPNNSVNLDEKQDLYKYFIDSNSTKEISDMIRPPKPLDPIVDFGNELAKNSGFIACNAALITICSLPSSLFPNCFKTQATLRYEKATQNNQIEVTQYNDAIINHQNAIKKHEILIKKVKLNTKIRNQKIKALLNSPGNLKS